MEKKKEPHPKRFPKRFTSVSLKVAWPVDAICTIAPKNGRHIAAFRHISCLVFWKTRQLKANPTSRYTVVKITPLRLD